MLYKNIYIYFFKNNKNYNLVLYNKNYKILLFLNIEYNIIKNDNFYLEIIKSYFIENGINILLFNKWSKFGIKQNLILKLVI